MDVQGVRDLLVGGAVHFHLKNRGFDFRIWYASFSHKALASSLRVFVCVTAVLSICVSLASQTWKASDPGVNPIQYSYGFAIGNGYTILYRSGRIRMSEYVEPWVYVGRCANTRKNIVSKTKTTCANERGQLYGSQSMFAGSASSKRRMSYGNAAIPINDSSHEMIVELGRDKWQAASERLSWMNSEILQCVTNVHPMKDPSVGNPRKVIDCGCVVSTMDAAEPTKITKRRQKRESIITRQAENDLMIVASSASLNRSGHASVSDQQPKDIGRKRRSGCKELHNRLLPMYGSGRTSFHSDIVSPPFVYVNDTIEQARLQVGGWSEALYVPRASEAYLVRV